MYIITSTALRSILNNSSYFFVDILRNIVYSFINIYENMHDKLNKILQMDCLEYLKELPDKCVDLVLIDPPYLYNDYSQGNKGFDEAVDNIEFIKSISSGFEVKATFDICKKVLKKINIFCFCSTKQLPEIMNWGLDNNFQVNVLIWKKGGRPFGATYLHDVEFIVHIRETGSPFNGAYKSRVLECLSKREHGHPTEKPLKLIQTLIRYGSNVNDVVLDCFMGSGTTALGCIQEGRNFLGCEKEEKYVKIAEDRLRKAKDVLI